MIWDLGEVQIPVEAHTWQAKEAFCKASRIAWPAGGTDQAVKCATTSRAESVISRCFQCSLWPT